MAQEVASLRGKDGKVKERYLSRAEPEEERRPQNNRKQRNDKQDEQARDAYTPPPAIISKPQTEAQLFENLTYNLNEEIMPELEARHNTSLMVIKYNQADEVTQNAMLEQVIAISALPPEIRKQSAEEASLATPKPENHAHGYNYSVDVSIVTGIDKKTGEDIYESHHIEIIKDGKLQNLTIREQGLYILYVNGKAADARDELPDSKVGQTYDIAHFTQTFEGANLRNTQISETIVSTYMADVSIDYCRESGIRPHILQEDPRIVEMVTQTIKTGVLPKFSNNYNMSLRGNVADTNAALYPQGAHLTISNHFDGASHGNRGGTFGQINPNVEASVEYGKYILGEVDSRGVVNTGGNHNKLISSSRGFQGQTTSPMILIENGNGYNAEEASALGSASAVRQQAYATFNGIVKANLANGNSLFNSPQVLLASNELGIAGKEIQDGQMIARYDYAPQQEQETQLAINQPSDLAREALANMARDMPRPPFPDYTIDSNEENSLAFVNIADMDFGDTWIDTPPETNSNALMAANLTEDGTVKIPVSSGTASSLIADIMRTFNFADEPVKNGFDPFEDIPPTQENPFNVDNAQEAVAKAEAEIKPEVALVEIKERIGEMFAQFNGERGNVAMVYQRSTTLSPQDKAAATLVQQSLNLIEVTNIDDKELGHVAGGKTKQGAMDFQRSSGLKVDGIVGANTYAKLEEQVLKAIEDNPAKAQEFVAALEKSQERYLAELVADSKNTIAQNSATELPTPQNQAGQGVVPS